MNLRTLASLISFGVLSLTACAPDGAMEAAPASSSDELVVAQGSTWGRTIPVCWDIGSTQVDAAGSTRFADLRLAVRRAVEQSWGRATRVQFTGWGNCPSAGPFADRVLVSARPGRARASIGKTTNNWVGIDLTDANLNAVAIHEFGHTLGFYHEQVDPRTPTTCVDNDGDLRSNPAGSIAVSDWDPDSVMNYCNQNWTRGVLSPTDIAGAARFYGRRPHDVNYDQREDISFTPGTDTAHDGVIYGRSDVGAVFSFGSQTITGFRTYLAQGGVPVAGDFDGDGRQDIAFVRGSSNWTSIPVAFLNADGTYRWTNIGVQDIPAWSRLPNVRAVVADFNADGRDDIALAGGTTWGSTPMAISLGDGRFVRQNPGAATFAPRAATAGAQVVAGDFDGDGYADLAVTGAATWTSITVRFTRLTGTGYEEREIQQPTFALYATQGATAVSGDFDGNGRADIALVGGPGWNTVPIAFASGTTSAPGFTTTNHYVGAFGTYATQGSTAVAGDFDDDGADDIALVGGAGWRTIPVAWSRPGASFDAHTWSVTNNETPFLAGLAALPGVRPILHVAR